MENSTIFGIELNNVYVKSYLVFSFAIGLVYFYFLKKRNGELSVFRIIRSIINYLVLLIMGIFIIGGFYLIAVLIKEQQYIGLIVPLGWFYICYKNISSILISDFKFERKGLFKNNIALKTLKPLIIIFVFVAASSLFSFLCFIAMLDTANQPYGPFPLFIAGLIFLITAVLMFKMFFSMIKNKIKFVSTSSSSYKLISGDGDIAKKFIIIFIVYASLFVILFAYVFIKDAENKKAMVEDYRSSNPLT